MDKECLRETEDRQTDRQWDKKTETEKQNKMKFKSINKVFFQKKDKGRVYTLDYNDWLTVGISSNSTSHSKAETPIAVNIVNTYLLTK